MSEDRFCPSCGGECCPHGECEGVYCEECHAEDDVFDEPIDEGFDPLYDN